MAERKWSDEQNEIFTWCATPDGSNLIVEAYAGTGKSTTIAEGVNRAPETTIIVSSFTAAATADLKKKITNPNADVRSLHSAGLQCITRYWERIQVEKVRGSRAAALADRVCGADAPDAIKRLVAKLNGKLREMHPWATTVDQQARDIAAQFECEPDEQWASDGFTPEWVTLRAVQALHIAASEKPVATGIDFADMLFLPLVNKWLRKRYALGVVDETQDMTMVQLALFRGLVSGRICVVGDRRQAIFAFRGADSGSMDRLSAELKPKTLKLSTTYRCGRAIVALAQEYVPDYKAHESNGDGVVSTCKSIEQLSTQARPGDFVLSRVNAPLVGIALGLIRRGVRARIQGRDIGAGLKAIVRKLAVGPAKNSIPKWLERLSAWKEREVKRAEAENSEAKVDKVLDQYETLTALVDGCAGLGELEQRLENLFADNGELQVVCSSIHKAKGLEAERVFVLEKTLHPPVACVTCRKRPNWCKCQAYVPDPVAWQEERNLAYVAITRAKHELTWVTA